jgi:hypothetical protein
LILLANGLIGASREVACVRGAVRSSDAGGPGEAVEQLRVVVNRFGGEWTAKKSRLLELCAVTSVDDAPKLLAYHDSLLFMLAYPETPALLKRARGELRRVADAARRLSEAKSARVRKRLFGSGIAWSEQVSEFSYDIAAWFAQWHPASAEIDGAGERAQPLQSALKLCLLPIEAEFLEAEFVDVDALLDEAKGTSGGSRLEWLIAQFRRLPSPAIGERLFEALHLYVGVTPKDGPLSRTFARGLESPVFFHSGELLRHVNVPALLDEPVSTARRLSSREQHALLDSARGILAMLGRETDAISASTPGDVEYLELGRGVSIALYGMPPERRFPLDTHLGFVLFKNAIPVAYGGGWPFLEQCKIGINVFAPFRGGESTYLFAQVLRVYRQRFDVERFVVEPYQFGAHNREGLLSGAFWFYYRLGFRPAETPQALLARSEFERIERGTKYRSPLPVMRRFTRCNLELQLSQDAARPWPDPAQLGLAATEWIGRVFAGNRTSAEAAALERARTVLGVDDDAAWPADERHAFRALSTLIAMIPELERWTERERRGCVALMRAKGAKDETLYFKLIRRHRRFRAALIRLLEQPSVEKPIL